MIAPDDIEDHQFNAFLIISLPINYHFAITISSAKWNYYLNV